MIEYNTEEKLVKLGYKKGSNYYFKPTMLGNDIITKCNSCGRWGVNSTKTKRGVISVTIICECCGAKSMVGLDKRKLKILTKEGAVIG